MISIKIKIVKMTGNLLKQVSRHFYYCKEKYFVIE